MEGSPVADTQVQTTQFRDSNVSLNGGGSVTNPGAGATIASVTIATGGVYEVTITFFLSGTIAAGDANNLKLQQNAVNVLTPIPVPAVANSYPHPVTVVVSAVATDVLKVVAIGAASGASAVYNAS